MRELTYLGKRALEWREVPDAVLRSGRDAIVRPFVAARCDGDKLPLLRDATGAMRMGMAAHYLDPLVGEVLGARPYLAPFAFGHECVAQVLECGSDVRNVVPGDIVIVPWAISCGECCRCRNGFTSKCDNAGATRLSAYGFGSSMGDWGGSVVDRLRVPFADAMLVRVPAGIDPLVVASASDNVPDGFRMVGPHLKRFPGAEVLVVGGAARSIGLYAAAAAVALGASRVDYLDSNPTRLEIAESVGADPVQVPRSGRWLDRNAPARGGSYLIAADASASLPGLRFALRSLAPGGVCTGVGYYFARRSGLPLTHMYANSSTLHVGVSHARADLPRVLELLGTGRFQPEKVTSLVADWDDAPTAFLADTTKVVVRRDPLPMVG